MAARPARPRAPHLAGATHPTRNGAAPETAWALGINERSLRRIASGPGADRALLDAVRLRLAAEVALGATALLVS